METQWFD
jgi:ariadne-1